MSGRNVASWLGKGLTVAAVLVAMALGVSAGDQPRDQVVKIVTQIQRADYEGDRAALKRLHEELTPFVANKDLGARVEYWRGFALWRRAINGFNDHVDASELQADLKIASDEFQAAAEKDPAFADAKIAELSCLGFLAFSAHEQDPDGARIQAFITQGRQLRKEVEAMDPANPRLPWVMGPMIWNSPPERGGGQAKAMEAYEKGLEEIRKSKAASDPLVPSWGEPELWMSLAWSKLNQTAPDLGAAEKDAQAALALVPYWHYVRDILMAQIREARKKEN